MIEPLTPPSKGKRALTAFGWWSGISSVLGVAAQLAPIAHALLAGLEALFQAGNPAFPRPVPYRLTENRPCPTTGWADHSCLPLVPPLGCLATGAHAQGH